MDTRRKTILSTKCKYNKKDIKICGAESLKSSTLSTPPQTRNCRTPLMSRKNRNQDDYDGYNSEEASPVLLSTQEGGRGCEVTWDWRSPNRNELTPHNTPKEKVRRRVHHKNSVSPLLHLPCKRKLQQPTNKNFFDNLHAQLAEIQQKYQSSKKTSPKKSPTSKPNVENEPKDVEEDISELPTQIFPRQISQTPEKHETSGISEFFRDDSFTDYLITCSQAVENTIRKTETKISPDLNKNCITSKNNIINIEEGNKSPDLFHDDDETANFNILTEIQSTPKITNLNSNNSVRDKQLKNLSTKSPKFGNDDSFDAIISTFSEEAFSEYTDNNISDYNNCKKSNGTENSVSSFLNFTTTLQCINEDKEENFVHTTNNRESNNTTNINKSTACNKPSLNRQLEENFVNTTNNKNNSNTNIIKSATNSKCNSTDIIKSTNSFKPGFARHNSMPVSPRILGNNLHLKSVGRHSSMPYSNSETGCKLMNQRQRCLSDRTDSLDSLGSQSSSLSPIQCTPDEIEKKRQDALRKKEARRLKMEIERKRLEAIEKLQMKSKLQSRKNPR